MTKNHLWGTKSGSAASTRKSFKSIILLRNVIAGAGETLVEQALSMALTHRKPPEVLLYHSDRGCQYTSHAYQAFLKDHGVRVSMSRKGIRWDNSVMESVRRCALFFLVGEVQPHWNERE